MRETIKNKMNSENFSDPYNLIESRFNEFNKNGMNPGFNYKEGIETPEEFDYFKKKFPNLYNFLYNESTHLESSGMLSFLLVEIQKQKNIEKYPDSPDIIESRFKLFNAKGINAKIDVSEEFEFLESLENHVKVIGYTYLRSEKVDKFQIEAIFHNFYLNKIKTIQYTENEIKLKKKMFLKNFNNKIREKQKKYQHTDAGFMLFDGLKNYISESLSNGFYKTNELKEKISKNISYDYFHGNIIFLPDEEYLKEYLYNYLILKLKKFGLKES